ncbi:MAG: exonuclease domain-containing protein [Ktedonobacteraceae bacterium]
MTLHWVPSARNDKLAYRFYDILDTYAVPDEDADWLYSQQLIMDGMYIQARPMLEGLIKAHPAPERIWLLATAMQHCDAPAQEQLEVLRQFIAADTISNGQRGEAWQRIGELTQGMAAIEAFQEAERCGCKISQLAQYRAGKWDVLPGLHLEPDYAYPTIVVLDLENDYQPELPDVPDGSRVFEIAAVRMRGHTELATCNLVIKRDFPLPEKVAHLQDKAIEPKQAADSLQEFIDKSIVVGHNLEAFDAKHLRGMEVEIDSERIIDTLTFARLLYPDSVHHHLGLLCHEHGISFQGEQHSSLPDARACAALLQALGDELIQRDGQLLAGFRALVARGSAFDQAILQPRDVPADPDTPWSLDPAPATPHILATSQEAAASPGIVTALEQKVDTLVERYDLSGAYVQYLPEQQRAVVLVETQSRLERMIAQSQGKLDLFVLPDPHTLLCPYPLRQSIEQVQDWQIKLALFSLYEASHNHDARTLYPLRLPDNEDTIKELRRILLSSCCDSEWHHPENCPGRLALQTAIENHRVLLATHENYLRQSFRPKGDIVIVDDADQLQMHFAEYLAERITSEQVRNWSPEAFMLLNTRIEQYANDYVSDLGLHGRVPLRQMVPLLTQLRDNESETLVFQLRARGQAGEELAIRLEQLCQQALQEETIAGNIHAYWLELSATHRPDGKAWDVERWSICGLKQNLQQAFERFFLSGYKQHIICGAALSLGKRMDKPDTTFLIHFFQLPEMVFVVDPRPPSSVYIPLRKDVHPASFLSRRTWAKSVGAFLYRLTKEDRHSLVVSLQTPSVANALTDAFSSQEIWHQTQRQVLSLHQN